MYYLFDFLFGICVLGFYNWLGRHIYGPEFADKGKKQPLHRRMLVSGIAFSITIGIALVLLFLII